MSTSEKHSLFTVFNLIIAILITSAGLVIYEAVINAYPSWNGAYLLIVTFLISLESSFSKNFIKRFPFQIGNLYLYRFSELLVIFILLKCVTILGTNPGLFISDFMQWEKSFLTFFLQDSFILILFYVLVIWWITGVLSGLADEIEIDRDDLELEIQGSIRKNRTQIHQTLVRWVFGLGLLLTLIIALSLFNLQTVSFSTRPLNKDVLILLFYFLIGLLLLSKSQSVRQISQWKLKNIPIDPSIASTWLRFSIILLILVGVVVFFIPTGYSTGFLTAIQTLFNYGVTAFTYIGALLIGILLWIGAFISRLMGNEVVQVTPQVTQQLIITSSPSAAVVSPTSWFDLLKSLLYWLIFVSIILFAFYHYLLQRIDIFSSLSISSFWTRIMNYVRRLLLQFAETIHRSNESITKRFSQVEEYLAAQLHPQVKPKSIVRRDLLPRIRVIVAYLSWLHFNDHQGIGRTKYQTPFEYAQFVNSTYPDLQVEVNLVTQLFVEARYTDHSISNQQCESLQSTIHDFQKIILDEFHREPLKKDSVK